MTTVHSQITSATTTISENIEALAGNRNLMSRNIIKQLRDLTEGVIVRAHTKSDSTEYDYDAIKAGTAWIGSTGKKFNFLHRFHKLLQESESHYTFDGDVSERLMLKYYVYLLQIRTLLRDEFDLEVLLNLEDFPVDLDPSLREYHQKIAERIDAAGLLAPGEGKDDHYYVQSVRPFVVDGRILYEVTFTDITDSPSKFDRIIAFTNIDVSSRYASHLLLVHDDIEVLGRKMPIIIIREWNVAIRPCEIQHLAEIFGMKTSASRTVEYRALMQYLTETGTGLLDLMDMTDERYKQIRADVTSAAKPPQIFPMLDQARELVRSNAAGTNIVRYLMLKMNNRIIKLQQEDKPNKYLSSLRLTSRAGPFEAMPFAANPAGHVPRLTDLFEVLDTKGREHELLGRRIRTNVEQHGSLYTSENDLAGFDDLETLIAKHNKTLPPTTNHAGRTLEKDKGHVFMHQYENNTVEIIKRLQDLADTGICGHEQSVERWLDETTLKVDDETKRAKLKSLFSRSRVALIYGAAGTGKSTMVNYIANYFGDGHKLFLAHTNPAKANLERRVAAQHAEFRTIASHLAHRSDSIYDLLVIDECSVVSNTDMVAILKNTKFRLLVLVGDVFQIEAIQFGNWFTIAPHFLPKSAVSDLKKTWRTSDKGLRCFWQRVRSLDDGIAESIAHYGYSSALDETLFTRLRADEIILCLNYDGLYGINNINRFLQADNKGKAAIWRASTYKVGDPVVFGSSSRFHPLIYNNLKGRIVDIKVANDHIQFDVWLDRNLSEVNVWNIEGLEYVDESTVRFSVLLPVNTDSDTKDDRSVVPFQVAYAVSIHRAQGLEYKSVKLVITNANEDDISHGIFYTAVTRAREVLKIYWTPETQQKVLEQLKPKNRGADVGLLKSRHHL